MRVMSVSQAILVDIAARVWKAKVRQKPSSYRFCVSSVGKQGHGATDVQSPASWVSGVS